jgi:putative MFS transporter
MKHEPPSPALLMARLQRIPTTYHSWVIVLLAAGALIIEALNIGSLSITLPIIRRSMHLTPGDTGVLAAASALGIAIGMIPTGYLADRFGRKKLLIFGVIWFAGGTAISAFSPNFASLAVLRGLTGLGMAPAFIMPYTLTSEIVSATTRTAFAGILESALGIGYLLPPVLGMVIIPRFAPEIGWRVFTFVCGLPIVYVACIWKFLPESPRWLHRVGRYEDAEKVVCGFEERAERSIGSRLPEPEIDADTEKVASATIYAPPKFWWSMGVVWSPPYLYRTVTMIIGSISLFSMFYITVNYLPSLFVDKHVLLENAFFFTFIVTAAQIPWKIVNGIAAEHIGRKKIFVIYMLIVAVSVHEFGLAQKPLAMIFWGMMLFSASGAAPAYKMWYAEQYPTRVRATGQSVVEGIGGRLIGGVIWTALFPIMLSRYGLDVTMDVGVVITLVGMVIVALFVPETSRQTVEALETR